MVMLNAENVHSESDISGRARPLPGRYHVAIQHAEEGASKKKGTPGLQVEFAVICDGTGADKKPTQGQTGRTIGVFMSYVGGDDDKTQTCLSRVLRLALACGIMQPGQRGEPDWSEAVGREIVLEVVEGSYEDKNGATQKGSECSFLGFWSLGNKEVVDVPKDPGSPGMQALAKGGTPPADRGSAAKEQPKAEAPKKNKYADL